MDKLLLDTSILIDYLRRKDKENTIFEKIREKYNLVISFATVSELYSGKISARQEIQRNIQEIIDSCQIIVVDFAGSRKAGELRRDFGLALGDGFIAQLALEQDLILATLNTKDFGKVKGIKLYQS